MTPADRERWRRRIAGANAALIRKLRAKLMAEFETLAEEWAGGQRSIGPHRQRVFSILAMHQRHAFSVFGTIAHEMLAAGLQRARETGREVKAAPPIAEPEPGRFARIRAILTEAVAALAPAALVERIVDSLMEDRAVVEAVSNAVAANAADPAAAARSALARREVAERVAAAVIEGPKAPPNPQPEAPPAPKPAGAGRAPPAPPNPPSGGAGDPPRGFSERVAAYVREFAPLRARSIARTSEQQLIRILEDGARQGWAEQRVGKEIRAQIGGDIAWHRARAIARTEIGSAQNAATLALARESTFRVRKTWASIDDDRRRPSHEDAEGQTRALEEPFTLTDPKTMRVSLLMHPGDPHGPLNEIISCRCGLLLEPEV